MAYSIFGALFILGFTNLLWPGLEKATATNNVLENGSLTFKFRAIEDGTLG